MELRRLRWFRYRIPFRAPFVTAHSRLEAREGVLIALETADGRTGWGEIAPLPGFGVSVDEALACLKDAGERLVRERPSLLASPPILGERDGAEAIAATVASQDRGRAAPPEIHRRTDSAAHLARPRREGAVAVPLPQDWGRGQERGPSRSLSAFLDALLPNRAAPGCAAVRCGLETALLDLLGQSTGNAFARLLGEEPAAAIPVNATVGAADTARAAEQAAAAAEAGFGAVKLKVGMLPDAAAEAARVGAVRAALGPAVRLRLDANGGWTAAEAVAVLRACAPFDLEYVEQPVAADDLEGLAAVRRQSGVPIAADEAVADPTAADRLLALDAADVLVLKPMALGGALAAWRLAERARKCGIDVVVTSMLEAGVGIAAAAQLAAALPPPLRACGLATAGLLEHDLLAAPLRIDGGTLHVPTGPGLGVNVDEAALRHYTVAEGCWEARR